MKIIQAGYQIVDPQMESAREAVYKKLERAGRISYQSGEYIGEGSDKKIIERLIRDGHESVLEHDIMSVIFTVDRGVSHELVRHRLCAFTQESTRYCNYSKGKFGNEITFVEPVWFSSLPKSKRETAQSAYNKYCVEVTDAGRYEHGLTDAELEAIKDPDPEMQEYCRWLASCGEAEWTYLKMLKKGETPEQARAVLPNSLKTEVYMTANFREWRHIFKLRAAGTTGKPHPQIMEVMVPLLNECKMWMPELFSDITAMTE